MVTLSLKVFILFVFFIIPSFVCAQEKFSTRVKLVISPQDIKNEVESYLSRELRSLGDVIIVDDNPDWILNIIVMEPKTVGGDKIGFIFSVVVLRPFDNKSFSAEFFNLDKERKKFYNSLTNDLVDFEGHWVNVGSREDLKNICQRVVATFDTSHLQELRKVFQKAMDLKKGLK